MLNSLETLLDSITSFDLKGKHVALLNARYHPDLSVFSDCDLTLQQYFKPFNDDLVNAGFTVQSDIPNKSYDIVCILLPKNMVEARHLIASGLKTLRSGGVLVCAADNKAGGSRIKKILDQFGVSDLGDNAKNKARAVWGIATDINQEMLTKSYIEGKEQSILDNKFTSQAGIFGWNKIDKGSEILTHFLPKDLKGKGADFGCGYGYLSDFILSNHKKIKHLTCIDADYRAVELCRKNLSKFETGKDFLWNDLTKDNKDLRNLDFIIMNPPFHEGKNTDTSIGKYFIDRAHQSLRRGGRLYMVANNHLPYDDILEDKFFSCQKLYEGRGFKVFCALM